MQIICCGDRITTWLNDIKVDESTEAFPSEGWIRPHSDAAENRIRRYEVGSLDKFDEKWTSAAPS